jgi:hypothetical protein
MALTQMQIIQSLGEAMSWFERELGWGVPPTEIRHLCGRIGELYAALITNGQMATEVNQKGYDVVSGAGEKISVKTTATVGSSGTITFNANTLSLVDRIIVLRLNTEEMQIETLLDCTVDEAKSMMVKSPDSNLVIAVSKLIRDKTPKGKIKSIREVLFDGVIIRELESGTIEVERNGALILPAKPELRRFAAHLGVDILNENGNPRNTRQLGSLIVKMIQERAERARRADTKG